jgi:archaeal flagellar protein FlaJ
LRINPESEKIDYVSSRLPSGQTYSFVKSSPEKQKRGQPSNEKRVAGFRRFAYSHFSRKLPQIPGFRNEYEKSQIHVSYESFVASAIASSLILAVVAIPASFLVQSLFLHAKTLQSVVASLALSGTAFSISLFCWIAYPLQKTRSLKQKLEAQIAYSIGLMGVLSAAGIGVSAVLERISNLPGKGVMSLLAKRFVRNVKMFGMDTSSAIQEVASHSPSAQFSRMLESISVAFQTTGYLHDFIMFESQKLFAEKKARLRKSLNEISMMAELFISLVVVGPIIFIIMLVIIEILPGKTGFLPPAPLMINALVFIAIPAMSLFFIVLLDSTIQNT